MITCKSRNDGIGAQACGIISVIVVAMAFDLQFVYTPIRYVAHYPYPNPTQTELNLWKMGWEQLFDFGKTFPALANTGGERLQINHKTIISYFFQDQHTQQIFHRFKKGNIYGIRETHLLLSKFREHPTIISGWDKTLNIIRNNYNRSHEDTPHFKYKNMINIAVHVRRGDSVNTARRFVKHNYFINVLDDIIIYLNSIGKQYFIQLYSEGNRRDLPEFEKFEKKGTLVYRLNSDHIDTLHHMVSADILVMSKSTFSYLPALLNKEGMIVYKPFWLLPPKPLESKWIIADDDGHIKQSALIAHNF